MIHGYTLYAPASVCLLKMKQRKKNCWFLFPFFSFMRPYHVPLLLWLTMGWHANERKPFEIEGAELPAWGVWQLLTLPAQSNPETPAAAMATLSCQALVMGKRRFSL